MLSFFSHKPLQSKLFLFLSYICFDSSICSICNVSSCGCSPMLCKVDSWHFSQAACFSILVSCQFQFLVINFGSDKSHYFDIILISTSSTCRVPIPPVLLKVWKMFPQLASGRLCPWFLTGVFLGWWPGGETGGWLGSPGWWLRSVSSFREITL